MQPDRFDRLSRSVASALTRRRALKILAAGSVAGWVGVNTLPSYADRPPCGVGTLAIWLNAFIPRDIPGYTEPVVEGPFAGSTMFPAPFREFNGCGLTDQRSFSDFLGSGCTSHPSSRITAMVEIDMVKQSIRNQSMFSCGSQHVDCESGAPGCFQVAPVNGPGFNRFRVFDDGRMMFQLRGWGHAPCVRTAPESLVADIDFDLSFLIDRSLSGSASVSVSGRVDVFPAFEIYAVADGGSPITLFQHFPEPGATVGSLFTSQLAVTADGFGWVENAATCPGTSRCCPASLGGGCCDSGTRCCGEGGHHCCPQSDVCCHLLDPSFPRHGCCPPDAPVCCPPESAGGCCPADEPVCCPTGHCCPKGQICFVHPRLGPGCATPRSSRSSAEALAAGDIETFVPAKSQSRIPTGAADTMRKAR